MSKGKPAASGREARGSGNTSSDDSQNSSTHGQGPGVLQAALDYTARGWEVFPAPASGEKKSCKSEEYSGTKWGKTTDPAEIMRDFKKWPKANVGIATGIVSGFFVVETDTRKGKDGAAALLRLERERGWLPNTRMARSPSGSKHYYFNHPGPKIKNSTSELGPGIDVRGDGGMVIAPPSVRDGKAYRWLNDLEPADAPAWLIELVRAEDRARSCGDAEANENRVGLALAMIPNDDDSWDWWNKVGMATWRATGGSDKGLEYFDAWSQKYDGYDVRKTAERWGAYFRSPPDRIGAGTIFYLANEAVPNWDDRLDDPDVAAKIEAFLQLLGGAS
jgi:hypothetical protein